MKKLKLLLAFCALLLGWSNATAQTAPTASTPSVGNTYYLYNPTTKLFMTTNVDMSFVRPTGSAWKLEAAAGHDGWITLRLKDNDTDGCGYFWGKWWANNPAENSAKYADERVYQLVNISGSNYKLKSYAWGESNAYIYINKGNEGDRSYRLACNSHEQGGLDEGYVTWQFISEEDYATYMLMNYTSYIKNNDFIDGTSNWTLDGTGNKQAHGNTAIEYWKEHAADGTFDFHQEITVPAGKYILRAAMYNSTNGEAGASFAAPGQCGVYGTSNNVTENANVSVDGTAYNIYTTEELLVPDGNLRLGFKNSAKMTARWFGVDWIQLTCVDYCLSYVAEALPDGTDMTADKWYYFNIPVDANYTLTCSDLSDIVYTADGSTLLEAAASVTSTFASSTIALTAGNYYVKSSSAQTLSVAAASYSYELGSITAKTFNDGDYVKSLTTFVLTYGDAATNDGSASLAVIGTPVATLYKGGISTGKTGTLTANNTAKTLTATFSDVTLALNSTDYSIVFPAGAFGYEGKSVNEEVTVTFNTPIFADGDYYLKNKNNSAYFAGGNSWSTQAITNKLGHVVTLTALPSGKYTIDTKLSNGGDSHYLNGIWCDGAATGWQFTPSGDYYVISDGTNNLTAGAIGETMTLANGTEDNTKWTLLTKAAWKAENVARLDDAAANNGVDATFYITAPNFNRNDTENDTWQGSPNIDGINTNHNAQKWSADAITFDVYQELTGVKSGAYKLTMQGFYRNGTTDDQNAILYANSYEVPLMNIKTDGAASQDNDHGFTTQNSDVWVPNKQDEAAKAFDFGKYNNALFFNVGDDGKLRIGVKKTSGPGGDWTVLDNFQLTYYGDAINYATIGSYGYATFCSASDLDFTTPIDGLTAYKAASATNSTITLEEVTGKVKAGDGLVIKGDAGTYSIPVTTDASTIYTDKETINMWGNTGSEAQTVPVAATGTNFVLSVQEGNVVFAPVKSATASLKPGQAALWAGVEITNARALRISFGGITGVEDIEAASGATVKKNGAYLENGKIAIYKNGMKFSATGAKLK